MGANGDFSSEYLARPNGPRIRAYRTGGMVDRNNSRSVVADGLKLHYSYPAEGVSIEGELRAGWRL